MSTGYNVVNSAHYCSLAYITINHLALSDLTNTSCSPYAAAFARRQVSRGIPGAQYRAVRDSQVTKIHGQTIVLSWSLVSYRPHNLFKPAVKV